MWEPGLPAIAVVQPTVYCLIRRLHEQPPTFEWCALTARRHRLRQVIHHGFAHLAQVMRGPCVLFAAYIHSGFHSKFLGVEKQGGGVFPDLFDGYACVDAEQSPP